MTHGDGSTGEIAERAESILALRSQRSLRFSYV
jgi:hypothetical protein